MYSRSPCGSPCHIGSRHKDKIQSSACNETKWHYQWERLIVHLDTLRTRPSGSHWSTHWELKRTSFLRTTRVWVSRCTMCPGNAWICGCSTGTSFPGQKLGLGYTSISRETKFGSQDALISRMCLCCATALVDFQAPALMQMWNYAGFAIGQETLPEQCDGTPRLCSVTSGSRRQINITETITQIN